MSLRADTSQLLALEVDFSNAPGRIVERTETVLDRAALRIQRGMQRDASGHRYLKKLPRTVGRSRIGLLAREIGFDKRGQGNLANILVRGSVNNAPVFSETASLERDIPRLVNDIADAAEKSVLG